MKIVSWESVHLFLLTILITAGCVFSCSQSSPPPLCDISTSVGQDVITLTQLTNTKTITASATYDGESCALNVESRPEWLSISQTIGADSDDPDTLKLTADILQPAGNYVSAISLKAGDTVVEIPVSYLPIYDVTIFEGIGAAGVEIGESYRQIIRELGFSDTFCTLLTPGGAISGHLVQYLSAGVSIFLPGNGINPEQDAVSSIIILDNAFRDVTSEFYGVGASQAEIIAAYGAPDIEDTVENFWQYNNGIRWYWDSNLSVTRILIFKPGNVPIPNIDCRVMF